MPLVFCSKYPRLLDDRLGIKLMDFAVRQEDLARILAIVHDNDFGAIANGATFAID
ncbi:MAG: hypothetical protein HC890_03720, partial [Chloroflexaceae bacterium]|nr:hypothetical protein [Chloroflexaceae bacterium]